MQSGKNKIGIICAMEIEMRIIKKMMTKIQQYSISNINFITGNLNNIPVVLAVSGIGKVHSAVCTQTMILKFNPRLILNVGVAGAINQKLKIGDLVIATHVLQHDIDTTAVGDPKGFISGLDLININTCQEINMQVEKSLKSSNQVNVHYGIVASGDQFICDLKKLQEIYNDFDAIACDMECGSIGHVCFLNKISFFVLKSISDNANHTANFDYNKFKETSANLAGKIICQIIDKI